MQTILRFVVSNIISVVSKNRIFTSSKNPEAESYTVTTKGRAQRYGTRELTRVVCGSVSGKKLESIIN